MPTPRNKPRASSEVEDQTRARSIVPGLDPILSGRGLQLSSGALNANAIASSFRSVHARELQTGTDVAPLLTEYMAKVRAHLVAQVEYSGRRWQHERLRDFDHVAIADVIAVIRYQQS